ncbi:hypothetical protein NP493_87g04037 [Ridgeia piscesae]|uniref:Endonuclease/exonuclease/phosphatase domain-containing protein n=1 Tax=Ridgeia piscesae TaxID=27915 RepID=A0AAD9P8Z0_RIDPI|nr:hypothetical protein NP493_87g04037 [Ridgeia piscesae]
MTQYLEETEMRTSAMEPLSHLKDEIVAEDIPVANKKHTGSEISACKINMPHNQPPQIIVGVYRPPNRDVAMATYVREIIATLMQSYPTATFWICGDFNLPDMAG